MGQIAKFEKPEQRAGLPHDLDAEMGLLGALLYDNANMEKIADLLVPEAFHEPLHGRVYGVAKALIERGRVADPVTVNHGLAGDDGLSEAGGIDYLKDLVELTTAARTCAEYAGVIVELWRRRELIRLSESVAKQAKGGEQSGKLIEHTERGILGLQLHGSGIRLVGADEAIASVIEEYENAERGAGVKLGLSPIDDETGGFMKGEMWCLAGRPSMGKAQPLDANVLMANGRWKTMGDLVVGDFIAAIDGRESRVHAIHERGERQVYRLDFSDGRAAEACGDHLWRVHHRAWQGVPKVISTGSLIQMLGKKRYQRRLWIDAAPGDWGAASADWPIDPWLLGALLGNGGLMDGSPCISTPSSHVMERVRRALPPTVTAKPDGYCGWRLSNDRGMANPLLAALRALGLWGLSSTEKFVPALYMEAPPSVRRALLIGLMDTDGWCERFSCARISLSSKRLSDDVVALARSLGLWASQRPKPAPKYTHKGEQKSGHDAWVVSLNGPGPLFSEPAKAARHVPRRYKSPVLFAITPSRIASTRCITVTHPSALYITDDYVVTHNSAAGASGALNIARHGFAPSGNRLGVIEVSCEMRVEQLMRRHIADLCYELYGPDAPSYSIIRRRLMTEQQREMFYTAAHMLRDLGTLKSIYRTGLTISSLRSLIRRQMGAWARQGIETGLVIVDHMGLIRDAGAARGRTEQQGEVARDAKELAGDLEIPLLALLQLSRKVEERDDKRPMLSDLRDSGEWEQNADGVIGCYRDAYYAEREREPKRHDDKISWEERKASRWMEAIFLKIREGQTQTVKLWTDMARNAIRGGVPESYYAARANTGFDFAGRDPAADARALAQRRENERLADPDEPLNQARETTEFG